MDIVVPCLQQGVDSGPAKLRECIAHWRGKFTGLSGESSFDNTGQLVSPPIVVDIHKGAFRMLKSIP